MKHLLFLGLLSTLLVGSLQAQQLYQPRDIKQAYENGTRSPDGAPGKNYWQNSADYTINIKASPPDRTIKGSEQITYFNNSPDTLKKVVVDLLLNHHLPTAPRDNGTSEAYLTSGVHIDTLMINGRGQEWKDDPGNYTFDIVELPESLAPGDSVQLSFDWHYDVSKQPGREGQIDSTSFFLAYFYPRIAVYDDYKGWNTTEFTGRQEFYNDFGDYTVNVTVPEGYTVWGTGTLENAEQVLQQDALSRYQKSLTSDSTIKIASLDQLEANKITAQNGSNTWTFSSQYVPDVAFGLSDHFVWDAASVVVEDEIDRRASVQAAYNDTTSGFHPMVGYARHALDYFSHHWPGVPYPYSKMSVFQGGADMEYPMMANDSSFPDPVFTRFVAEHEIVHTYFPFYMGTNETRYAFMDEGWATAFELLIGHEVLGREQANELFRTFRVKPWITNPSTLEDLSIMTPNDMLTDPAYGHNVYGKAALGYLALKDLLGDELFKKCLHTYMERWNGKHPLPWDFFYSFNEVSGKNLNWFWKNWFFENSYIDLAIDEVQKAGQNYTVTLENIGGMPAPTDMKITYSDGSSTIRHQTPAIWKENSGQAEISLTTDKTIQSIELDGGIWMDANPEDNEWQNN